MCMFGVWLTTPPANGKLVWRHGVGVTELLKPTADSRVDLTTVVSKLPN